MYNPKIKQVNYWLINAEFYLIFRYTIYFVVFCVTILSGARLKDVSYSIKQNGVMINIDYDVPIDDDDIIVM